MKGQLIRAWVLIAFLGLGACGGGGGRDGGNAALTPRQETSASPVPVLGSLSPSRAPAGLAALSLDVAGSNLVPTSIVRWNGTDRPTRFVSANLVTAQLTAADVAVVGTAQVSVFNPAPGGGSSSVADFTIDAGDPSRFRCIGPYDIDIDPSGQHAYVANGGCDPTAVHVYRGYVTSYAIDAATGRLAPIGSRLSTSGDGAKAVTVDPSGRFVFVASWGEGDLAVGVDSFARDSTTGALSLTGTGSGTHAPWSVAVHPSGRFAYVTNEGGYMPTGITTFGIDAATGVLTNRSITLATDRAVAVVVEPRGRFAYVTNTTSTSRVALQGNVNRFSIDVTTGALTRLGSIAAGLNPDGIALDPSGQYAYVANKESGDVSMYRIDATSGALTSLGSVAAGVTPNAIAVHPSAGYAYVVNGRVSYAPTAGSDDISMFAIDPVTGRLAPLGAIATGSGPTSIVVHPSGAFAYVTNSGARTVSIYRIDAVSGHLSLIGTADT